MPISTDKYSVETIEHIAAQFLHHAPLTIQDFDDKGNINQHTYLIKCEGKEYLLQRINEKVFKEPKNVMMAMQAAIEGQRRQIKNGALPQDVRWEPITLVSHHTGSFYHEHPGEDVVEVWRMMEKIPKCKAFKSLKEVGGRDNALRIAKEAGRGLAIYLRLTSKVETDNLANPLPGYRDTPNYYRQLIGVLRQYEKAEQAEHLLPTDHVTREGTKEFFRLHTSVSDHHDRKGAPGVIELIDVALQYEEYANSLVHKLKQGELRTVAIHGDTKIENFLFDIDTDKVIALVDLDTVLPHTWLSDWGDMVRSFVNVAGEKESDPNEVQVDMEIYAAVAAGFLAEAHDLPSEEKSLMADAVEILTLELGVRFLQDYLRGDNYFVPGEGDPWDINRIRAMVQITLFQRLRQLRPEIERLLSL